MKINNSNHDDNCFFKLSSARSGYFTQFTFVLKESKEKDNFGIIKKPFKFERKVIFTTKVQ